MRETLYLRNFFASRFISDPANTKDRSGRLVQNQVQGLRARPFEQYGVCQRWGARFRGVVKATKVDETSTIAGCKSSIKCEKLQLDENCNFGHQHMHIAAHPGFDAGLNLKGQSVLCAEKLDMPLCADLSHLFFLGYQTKCKVNARQLFMSGRRESKTNLWWDSKNLGWSRAQ